MKGFPKKIATGNDLYNCLSLVQAGELPANELSAAIEAVEERQYIAVPIVEISEDRKTVVINPCAEVAAGVKVKNNYTTTIKEAQRAHAEAVLSAFKQIAEGAFDKLGDLFDKIGVDLGSLLPDIGGGSAEELEEGAEKAEELMIVSLSRAMEEGEKVLKVLSDVSPFEVLGISADEVKSIKGVLKNYALSDK